MAAARPSRGMLKRYRRGESSIDILGKSTVKRLPVLSMNYGVSDYFGIVLEHSVAVPPEGEVRLYFNLPADTGVFAVNGKSYKQIDLIGNWPKKFSLYGTSSDGLVYRHCRTRYHQGIPRAEPNTITTGIDISNKSGNWTLIGKMIFSGQSFNLFEHRGRTVGELIEVQVHNDKLTLVRLKNRPSVDGAAPMPHVRPNSSVTIEMRYGL